MADKPTTPHLSLAQIEAEAQPLEPFGLALRNSKVVHVKDPFSFKLSERAEVMAQYERAKRGEIDDLDLLQQLMSEKDYVAYVEADLPIRAHARFVQAAMAYFEQSLAGTPGESGASPA